MKTSEQPPQNEPSQRSSEPTPNPRFAPNTPQHILHLQRSHGNRAVQRYVAAIQRLADTRRATATNPKGTIDIQTLTLPEVREYLQYLKWGRSPKTSAKVPPEISFGNREAEELHLNARLRKLETEESASNLDGLRMQVEQLRKGLITRMGEIGELAKSFSNPDVGFALTRQMQHFARVAEESQNLEPKTTSAKLNREQAIESHLRELVGLLQRTIDIPVQEVQALALPKLDHATIVDWGILEREKGRARKIREPIDAILMAFAPRISAIVPTGTLNYRGSLARAVKSPKKYSTPHTGPALATFDAPFQEVDSKSGRTTNHAPSYDIDLNIEAAGGKLGDLGLESGPLDATDVNNPTRQQLEQLLVELKKALTSLNIAELDVEGCKFFINSKGKSIGQLAQGTPYTPGMIANAGMPALATALPQAHSPELIRKVIEYATATKLRVVNGQNYYHTANWDPLMGQMFNHILANGPLATFMPDVQVEVGEKKTREYTGLPMPTVPPTLTGGQRAPHNPLTQFGGGFVGSLGRCTNAAHVVTGAVFIGQVSKQLGNHKSVLVDIGAGVTCFLPGPWLNVNDWGVFEVTGPPAPPQRPNASVKYHGKP